MAQRTKSAFGRRRVIAYHGRCFDGALSAALVEALLDAVEGPAAATRYRPLAHQQGRGYDARLLAGDCNAVVDFKYSTSHRLHWWFDHHKSGFRSPRQRAHFEARRSPQMFFAPEYPSCSMLIHDVARDRFGVDLGRFGETLRWADLIDSARFSSAQQAVELTEPALQLMTYIEASSDAEVNALIPRFGRESLAAIVAGEPVHGTFERLFAEHWRNVDRVRAAARLTGQVLLTDLTATPLDGINKFIGFYLFPDAVYSVAVIAGPRRAKVAVGTNPWRAGSRRHDIAALCEPYGGGGHAAVGAVTLPAGQTAEALRVAREIAQQLARSTP
ncbi:MAG: phosphoesterase [Deltaproteobacteria bacterium]|nr:phosphoesterase [Deltaproteobacteria bacterium]